MLQQDFNLVYVKHITHYKILMCIHPNTSINHFKKHIVRKIKLRCGHIRRHLQVLHGQRKTMSTPNNQTDVTITM